MGPWWLRQLAVFGSISPTSSNGYALWLRNIDEWNSITADASLANFLDQGLGRDRRQSVPGTGRGDRQLRA